VTAGEGEHAGAAFQRGRGAGEAVRRDTPACARIGHPQLLEAAAGEPVADLRQQVRLPAAAGPYHRAAAGAQLSAVIHRAPDVFVGHVAEHAARKDQVGGRHPGVVVGERGIAGHHLDPGQPGGPRRLPRRLSVARVEFDQAGHDIAAAGMTGQGADQVTTLTRAQADGVQRTRRRAVQRGLDPLLHRGQAPGQRGVRVVVIAVPGVPVAFGHRGHGTDVASARPPGHNAVVGSRTGRDGGMERGTLEVAGVRRGYWLARAPGAGAAGPLLIVLHGLGMTGRDVATTFTGLATRGPAAGVTAVFPDGWRGVWHIARAPDGEPALDDAAFLVALVRHLGDGASRPLFLAGLSNGAGFAEHVARHGLLRLAGLFLVAGTIREFSRQAAPVPRQPAAVTIMAGTGDPTVRYDGGPLSARGIVGVIMRRRSARHGDLRSERVTAAVETVARDWAAGNGIPGDPAEERLPDAPGDPPVTRLTWSAPGCPPVVLYRIEGGGHGWPGGPQFLPARVVGRIPRHLDASGILLDMVTANRGVSDDVLPPPG
jgi:polyhydroxybutyrate depolymerase